MADVANSLNSWSSTASSNSPNDNTTIGSGLADNLQAIQAVVRGDLAAIGSAIASSASPDVGAVAGLSHSVSGNATITGLGSTATSGLWKVLFFEGSPLLKHSTALQMVTAADVTASPGAAGVFQCMDTNVWKNFAFSHATAGSLVRIASTTVAGVLEVSTNAEALAGTSDSVAITPSSLNTVLGLVKLASGNCSATAVCDVAMASYTSYKNKLLHIQRFQPATDGTSLYLRFSTDGGTTFDAGATAYGYIQYQANSAGTFAQLATAAAQVSVATSIGNSSNAGVSAAIDVFDSTINTVNTLVNWRASFISNAGNISENHGTGGASAAQDTDAIRILFSSGNIASGSWKLYGYN